MAKRHNLEHSPLTRARIKTGMLITALTEHIEGKREMTLSQVRAALGLLRKTMPDISTYHVEGTVTHSFVDFLRSVEQLRRAELPAPVVDVLPVTEEVRH